MPAGSTATGSTRTTSPSPTRLRISSTWVVREFEVVDELKMSSQTCMDDINSTANELLSKGDVLRFLDLGCSPGGFSTW